MENEKKPDSGNIIEPSANLLILYETLKKKKRLIIRCFIFLSILLFGLAYFLYICQIKKYTTEAEFTLAFDGVTSGRYPNNAAFDEADILDLSILTEVYRNNFLEPVMDFTEFKDAITITQTNDNIAMLEMEYSYKYYEPKLSLSEKMKLEELFRSRKESMQKPVFKISFSRESRFEKLAHVQKAKIINDILREYSVFAAKLKGANQYRASLISTEILKDLKNYENQPLIHLDKVQTIIDELLEDIDFIKNMPGASLIRIKDGITIFDLEYYIKHLQFNELMPSALIAKEIMDSDEILLNINYIKIRLNTLELEKEKLDSQYESYKQNLFSYVKSSNPAARLFDTESPYMTESEYPREPSYMIPQFSSSFVETIMDLFKEEYDSKFIQELISKISSVGIDKTMIDNRINKYNSLLKNLNDYKALLPESLIPAEPEASFLLTKDQIVTNLRNIINDMNAIYSQLTRLNTKSESIIYRFTKPAFTKIQIDYMGYQIFIIALLVLVLIMSVLLASILFIYHR